jgi:hypothetical protein
MSWNGRFWRLADSRRTPSPSHPNTRDVEAFLAKVTAEAWGPIDDITRAIDRQRVADQEARMHGAGQLF